MLVSTLTIYHRSLYFNAQEMKLRFIVMPTPMHAAVSTWFIKWMSKFPPEAQTGLDVRPEADVKGLGANQQR